MRAIIWSVLVTSIAIVIVGGFLGHRLIGDGVMAITQSRTDRLCGGLDQLCKEGKIVFPYANWREIEHLVDKETRASLARGSAGVAVVDGVYCVYGIEPAPDSTQLNSILRLWRDHGLSDIATYVDGRIVVIRRLHVCGAEK